MIVEPFHLRFADLRGGQLGELNGEPIAVVTDYPGVVAALRRRVAMPGMLTLKPCLPTRARFPPSGPDWLYEPSTMGASIEAPSVPPRSGAVALGGHLPSLPQGQ
jgi:hypothetical protein